MSYPLSADEAIERLAAMRGGRKKADPYRLPTPKIRKQKETKEDSVSEPEQQESAPVEAKGVNLPKKRVGKAKQTEVAAPAAAPAEKPKRNYTRKGAKLTVVEAAPLVTVDPAVTFRPSVPELPAAAPAPAEVTKHQNRAPAKADSDPKFKHDRAWEAQLLQIIAIKHNYKSVTAMLRGLGLTLSSLRRSTLLSAKDQIIEAMSKVSELAEDPDVTELCCSLKGAVTRNDVIAALQDFPYESQGKTLILVIKDLKEKAPGTKERSYGKSSISKSNATGKEK